MFIKTINGIPLFDLIISLFLIIISIIWFIGFINNIYKD